MSIRLPALLGCVLLTAAAPAHQEPAAPVESMLRGEWRNTNDTVHLRVDRCGEGYCGTVIWAIDKARSDAKRGSGKDLIGSELLRDLRPQGEGKWRGKVFIPDINADGTAMVTRVDDSTLLISGCVFLGLACKTQHWWRLH